MNKHMKKLAFVTGALSLSLTCIGVMFKIMHWPGANILIVVGITLMSLIFIPSMFKYLYDKG